ncbi:MAG TPA: hypothetical protein G4N99_03470 [Thermoflexia bacterium]|nr:hypothetical protein [Thermoflexia bacterium]
MTVVDVVRWVAYALLIALVIPVYLAFVQFSKTRRAQYYFQRRDAFKLLRRWMGLALVMLIAAIILLTIVPPLLASIAPAPTPTLTAPPTRAPTLTLTPLPTRPPTATPTRRPTATPPTIPTPTSSVPLPDPAFSPLPSAVPAGEGAHITLVALALERDGNGQPVNPGNKFPPGDQRVYLFFAWDSMQNGNMTTFAWYKDGEFLDFCSDTWLWGMVEGRDWGERGHTSYYCKLPAGWEPGSYEIHVFIETRLQGVAQFVIKE